MSIKLQVTQLVSLVEAGRITEALQTFYDPDVAMQENTAAPVVGREANIAREHAFFGSITLHRNTALSLTVDDNRAVINWLLEFTGSDGKRYSIDQVAVQEWRNGRVIRERFVYDSAAIAA